MSQHRLELIQVGKRYRIIGGQTRRRETVWALKDVNLKIDEGEVCGVVGPNGAGKSTLLKLLTRITPPSEGLIRVRGRVGALLEVGSGFHPDLTGRENIFLSGAILGMTRSEIKTRLDEIIEFSGVERYIDTQTKRYSSGMFMRLAFAVAAHLQSDILLVDEVLAVGDARFQEKCLGRLREAASTGRTVLFVSHNMLAVRQLCDRAVFIQDGSIVADGNVEQVTAHYLGLDGDCLSSVNWEVSRRPGDDRARLISASVKTAQGKTSTSFRRTEPIVLEMVFNVKAGIVAARPAFGLIHQNGTVVLNADTNQSIEHNRDHYQPGTYVARCEIPGHLLNCGRFSLVVTVYDADDRTHPIVKANQVLTFEVVDTGVSGSTYHGTYAGIIRPALGWRVDAV